MTVGAGIFSCGAERCNTGVYCKIGYRARCFALVGRCAGLGLPNPEGVRSRSKTGPPSDWPESFCSVTMTLSVNLAALYLTLVEPHTRKLASIRDKNTEEQKRDI